MGGEPRQKGARMTGDTRGMGRERKEQREVRGGGGGGGDGCSGSDGYGQADGKGGKMRGRREEEKKRHDGEGH